MAGVVKFAVEKFVQKNVFSFKCFPLIHLFFQNINWLNVYLWRTFGYHFWTFHNFFRLIADLDKLNAQVRVVSDAYRRWRQSFERTREPPLGRGASSVSDFIKEAIELMEAGTEEAERALAARQTFVQKSHFTKNDRYYSSFYWYSLFSTIPPLKRLWDLFFQCPEIFPRMELLRDECWEQFRIFNGILEQWGNEIVHQQQGQEFSRLFRQLKQGFVEFGELASQLEKVCCFFSHLNFLFQFWKKSVFKFWNFK